ncbi:MAG: hypothetical protein K2Q01_06325, partial [Rickettsiales bacterium]|nr:hypothetical protein [Rickettsiales bacterium]
TVTSGGAGNYYPSKTEAIAAVKKLRASGVKNIDVGCMQVNLHYHSDAFANLEQAFEPEYNIAYSATFLRRLYNEEKSWKTAASYYHSKTPSLGTKYIGMVYDSWFKIIEKLREARLTVPASSVAGMNEIKGGKKYASAKVEPYVAPVQAKPAYEAPRMKSIKVSAAQTPDTTQDTVSYTRKSRESDIIVVRADAAAASQPVVINSQPAMPAPAVAQANQNPAANAYVAPAAAVSAPVSTTPAVVVTPNASQVNVAVPLSGVAQAAIAPVTGLANAVLADASGYATREANQLNQAAPGAVEADRPISTSFSERRTIAASTVSYSSGHAGPNFIFSE